MAVNYDELVAGAICGKNECKRELYDNTVRDVYDIITARTGAGETADRITKEVYSTAFSRLKRLKRPEDFPLWVKAIAIESVAAFEQSGEEDDVRSDDVSTDDVRVAVPHEDDVREAPPARTPVQDTSVDEPTKVIPTVSAPKDDFVDEPTRVIPVIGKRRPAVSQPPEKVSSSPVADFVKSVVAMPYFKYAAAAVALLLVVLIVLVPTVFLKKDITEGLDLPDSVVALIDSTTYSAKDDIKISDSITMHRGNRNKNMIIEIKNFLNLRSINKSKIYNINLYKGSALSVSYTCYYPDSTYVYTDDGLHEQASFASVFRDGSVTLFLSEHEIREYGIPDRICISSVSEDGSVMEILPDMDYMYDKGKNRYVPYDSSVFEKQDDVPAILEEEAEPDDVPEDDPLAGAAFDTTYLDYAGKTYDEIVKKFGEGSYNSEYSVYMFSSKLGYAFANGDMFGCTAVMTSLDYIISGCPDHLSADQLKTLIGNGYEAYDEMEDSYVFYFTYRKCPGFITIDGTAYTPHSNVTYNAIDLEENDVAMQQAKAAEAAAQYIAETSVADGKYTVTLSSFEEAAYGVWASAKLRSNVSVSTEDMMALLPGGTLSLSAYGLNDLVAETIEQTTLFDRDATIINGTERFIKEDNRWVYLDPSDVPFTYASGECKLLFTTASKITDYSLAEERTLTDIREFNGSELNIVNVTVSDHYVTDAIINYHP